MISGYYFRVIRRLYFLLWIHLNNFVSISYPSPKIQFPTLKINRINLLETQHEIWTGNL